MKAAMCFLAMVGATALCTGCVGWRTPVKPPQGFLFTNYRAPLTVNPRDSPIPAQQGIAKTVLVRDILFTGQTIAWDEASIQKAAQERGLAKVCWADYEVLQVLGLYAQFTVRIHGE